MTPNIFAELQAKYPLVKQLIGALDLELDTDYYRIKNATNLAIQYFGKNANSVSKFSVLERLEKQFNESQAQPILNFWLRQKIVVEDKDGGISLAKEHLKDLINTASNLAKQVLEKSYLTKTDLLVVLKTIKIPDAENEVSFWLKNKIVNTGYAYFGTTRQVRQEIIFIGDCPF